jgi:hypothetical protein
MATAKYWPFFYRNIKIILKAAEKRTESRENQKAKTKTFWKPGK